VKRPTFSVMIPTVNRAAMLRSAFKSLQWQTFADFEALVMDGGSTDATPEVFAEFASDPRFSFRRFPAGTELSARRNAAVEAAKGRWIAFLDDDDLWLPERLRRFADAIEAAPSRAFWYSNSYVWRFDRVVGRMFDPARPIPEGKVPAWYGIGEDHLPYVTTNMVLRADAVAKAGPFRASPMVTDCDMVVRVLAAGYETGVIREPLAVRRLHDRQTTRDHVQAFRDSAVTLSSARMDPREEAALRRRLAHDAATYLIKDLAPEKARAFLAEAPIPRDAAWWRLYAAAHTPRPVLAALRAARAALLRKGPVAPPARSAEFASVEELVRPLM
jgi:GT2 family glycosyltransferase